MSARVAVLISGRGSNLQALINACATPSFPAKIALVISNVSGAEGLRKAERANIPTQTLPHKNYDGRESFDAAIDAALKDANIDMICLAGFMRIFSDGFARKWQGKIINIHPSLLPAFKGMHVHRQALEAGVRISGCTVHYVVPELDSGPIIAQAAVPVEHDDTEETLAARILQAEHRLYPAALKLLVESGVKLENGKAVFAR